MVPDVAKLLECAVILLSNKCTKICKILVSNLRLWSAPFGLLRVQRAGQLLLLYPAVRCRGADTEDATQQDSAVPCVFAVLDEATSKVS